MKFTAFLILYLGSLVVFGCSRAKTTPEQDFWNWFQSHQDMLFSFEKNQESVFDELGAEMHKIDPNLTFEFGPVEDGRREFVISADGIKTAFPQVEALYAAAPSLPRWKFTKFRPRRKPLDVSYEGLTIQAASVRVKIQPKGQVADLTIFIPGFTEDKKKTYQAASFLVLDGALGEYDVETRVDGIHVAAKPADREHTYSLEDFPKAFDAALAGK